MNEKIISKLMHFFAQSNNISMLELRSQEKSESNSRINQILEQGFQIVYNYLDAFICESDEKEQQYRNDLIWFCNKYKFDEENLLWSYFKKNPNKYSWLDKDFIKIVIRDFRRNK